MSEPTRYDFDEYGGCYELSHGDYILHSDYEKEVSRLKAEVERFKFTLEEERQITRQDWAGLRCEHDRVKRALEQAEAEVERLRKWMDDISLDTEGRLDSGLNVGWTLLKIKQEYNAAKEGKQQS